MTSLKRGKTRRREGVEVIRTICLHIVKVCDTRTWFHVVPIPPVSWVCTTLFPWRSDINPLLPSPPSFSVFATKFRRARRTVIQAIKANTARQSSNPVRILPTLFSPLPAVANWIIKSTGMMGRRGSRRRRYRRGFAGTSGLGDIWGAWWSIWNICGRWDGGSRLE